MSIAAAPLIDPTGPSWDRRGPPSTSPITSRGSAVRDTVSPIEGVVKATASGRRSDANRLPAWVTEGLPDAPEKAACGRRSPARSPPAPCPSSSRDLDSLSKELPEVSGPQRFSDHASSIEASRRGPMEDCVRGQPDFAGRVLRAYATFADGGCAPAVIAHRVHVPWPLASGPGNGPGKLVSQPGTSRQRHRSNSEAGRGLFVHPEAKSSHVPYRSHARTRRVLCPTGLANHRRDGQVGRVGHPVKDRFRSCCNLALHVNLGHEIAAKIVGGTADVARFPATPLSSVSASRACGVVVADRRMNGRAYQCVDDFAHELGVHGLSVDDP